MINDTEKVKPAQQINPLSTMVKHHKTMLPYSQAASDTEFMQPEDRRSEAENFFA